jgi:hypothetical protein
MREGDNLTGVRLSSPFDLFPRLASLLACDIGPCLAQQRHNINSGLARRRRRAARRGQRTEGKYSVHGILSDIPEYSQYLLRTGFALGGLKLGVLKRGGGRATAHRRTCSAHRSDMLLMAAPYLFRANSDSVPTLVIHNLKPTFVEHRQIMSS